MLMMGFCEILLQTNCNQLVAGMLLERNLEENAKLKENMQQLIKIYWMEQSFIVNFVCSQLVMQQGCMLMQVKKTSGSQRKMCKLACCGTWDEPFKAVKFKIWGGLSALRKLKNIISQSQLRSVFHAIVEGHFRCTIVIWGSL